MKLLKRNQKGQGLMEYLIISSLVGVFCLGAMKLYGDSIKKRIQHMRSEITRTLKL